MDAWEISLIAGGSTLLALLLLYAFLQLYVWNKESEEAEVSATDVEDSEPTDEPADEKVPGSSKPSMAVGSKRPRPNPTPDLNERAYRDAPPSAVRFVDSPRGGGSRR